MVKYPKYPAVVDEILYFGGFWDEAGIYAHKNDIIAVTKEIKELFQRAYRFLAAAKFIRDDIENIYENACDHGKFNYAIEVLIDEKTLEMFEGYKILRIRGVL